MVPRRPRRHHRPARIIAWCQREPAVPGVAAGPSGLALLDIDVHGGQLPPRPATRLLPAINLAAEPISRNAWDDPARFGAGGGRPARG